MYRRSLARWPDCQSPTALTATKRIPQSNTPYSLHSLTSCFRKTLEKRIPTPPFSAPPVFPLQSSRAFKIGPHGVCYLMRPMHTAVINRVGAEALNIFHTSIHVDGSSYCCTVCFRLWLEKFSKGTCACNSVWRGPRGARALRVRPADGYF